MSLYRRGVGLLEALRRPLTPGYAPLCVTCGRHCDSYEIVEGYPGQDTFCRVLARHHGSEELATFAMGSTEWEFEDLARHVRGHNWFDPTIVPK